MELAEERLREMLEKVRQDEACLVRALNDDAFAPSKRQVDSNNSTNNENTHRIANKIAKANENHKALIPSSLRKHHTETTKPLPSSGMGPNLLGLLDPQTKPTTDSTRCVQGTGNAFISKPNTHGTRGLMGTGTAALSAIRATTTMPTQNITMATATTPTAPTPTIPTATATTQSSKLQKRDEPPPRMKETSQKENTRKLRIIHKANNNSPGTANRLVQRREQRILARQKLEDALFADDDENSSSSS
mmetsp:Transcript_13124/g.30266  ORF Transcript_13124/g.30266 Transcript_13124/m.30266 type:complete len:247 (+) Transcript_13124:1-741(+)